MFARTIGCTRFINKMPGDRLDYYKKQAGS